MVYLGENKQQRQQENKTRQITVIKELLTVQINMQLFLSKYLLGMLNSEKYMGEVIHSMIFSVNSYLYIESTTPESRYKW